MLCYVFDYNFTKFVVKMVIYKPKLIWLCVLVCVRLVIRLFVGLGTPQLG